VEVNELVNDVYKRRMAIAAATDNLPDVFITWSGATLAEYARLGKVLPLTGYMQKNGYQDRFLPAAVDQASVDGDVWAVPVENVAPGVGVFTTPRCLRATASRCRRRWRTSTASWTR
jgi:raffinose/stachyose/melibiose transport system substrate-binding protein